MSIIRQTNRALLFEEINPEKLNLLTMIGDAKDLESLDDDTIKEIHRKLLVRNFDEFLDKFEPVVYSFFNANTQNVLYTLEKPSNIPDEFITEIPLNRQNEKYIDEFLDSIDKGVYHETAAKVLAAVGYGEETYKSALDLVRTGVYYPTDYAGLAVAEDAAKELGRMGYPLRACEGFNYCYDIDSADRLAGALERGAAITIPDKSVAVELKKVMYNEDWVDFRNYIVDKMGDNISDLKGSDFAELRQGFEIEKLCNQLYSKVRAEYDTFITAMQKETTAVAIESAYEIVWKDNIVQYLENKTPDLSANQYSALMSSKNTLDEIYNEWCSNGELHSYDDVGIAIEDTAKNIEFSLEREQREREQPPVIPETKIDDVPAPKRKSR